jgi:hypothetical protein
VKEDVSGPAQPSTPAAQETWEIMRELVLNNERRS